MIIGGCKSYAEPEHEMSTRNTLGGMDPVEVQLYHEIQIDNLNESLNNLTLSLAQIKDINDSIAVHRREVIRIRNHELMHEIFGASEPRLKK